MSKTRLLLFAFTWDSGAAYEATIENVVFLDASGPLADHLFGESPPGEILSAVLFDSPIGDDENRMVEIADLLVPPDAGVWAAEFAATAESPYIAGEVEWVFLSPPLANLDQWEVSLRPQRDRATLEIVDLKAGTTKRVREGEKDFAASISSAAHSHGITYEYALIRLRNGEYLQTDRYVRRFVTEAPEHA